MVDREQEIRITYFSDVLCVWAYLAQAKINEIEKQFGDVCDIEYRFVSVFGNTHSKLVEGWADRGGIEAYARHVIEIAGRFEHEPVHPDIWLKGRPASSMATHQYLVAVRNLQDAGDISHSHEEGWQGKSVFEELTWRVRCAFFRDCADVASWDVLDGIAGQLGLSIDEIHREMRCGMACAQLFQDQELKDALVIEGSPTFVLNQGRQKLYGNVGYRIIEANIRELLENRSGEWASWC